MPETPTQSFWARPVKQQVQAWYTIYMNRNTANKPLTTRQKAELTAGVKKTVKQYKKTLDLLAKT